MTSQSCVKTNSEPSTLYVPAGMCFFGTAMDIRRDPTLTMELGDYEMRTWVTLENGSRWAFRLDGFITRTGGSSSYR